MQVLPAHPMAPALPSPTLTNPDMILPWDQSYSPESSPSTAHRRHGVPSSPPTDSRMARGDRADGARWPKAGGQSLSPFRNGILTNPGVSTRVRSTSERGDGRIKYENSRISYKPRDDVIASSPTLGNDYKPSMEWVTIRSDDGESDDVPDNTYTTPAVLEEDDEHLNSHMAMSKRAEEILAIAKKRLNNMEGNLNRARSTLNSRPSSSMSSFTNQSGDGPSMYVLRYYGGTERVGPALLKHRQGAYDAEDARQGHARVFSETSVPSSFHTGLNHGHEKSQGLGISSADASAADRSPEPSRWFWKGLPGATNLTARHNHLLEPLNENDSGEDGSGRQDFEREGLSDARSLSDENLRSRSAGGWGGEASSFDFEGAPAHGLTRSRSTAPLQDVLGQVQGLKDKISTLKEKARKDSFRRRSQNLRTPSPFTAADPPENWNHGVPLAGDRQATDPDLQKPSPGAPKEGNLDVGQVTGDDRKAQTDAHQAEREGGLGADWQDQPPESKRSFAHFQSAGAVDPTVGVAVFEEGTKGVEHAPPGVIARDFEEENWADLPDQVDFGDDSDGIEDAAAVHASTDFANEPRSEPENLDEEDFEGDDDFQEATLVLAEDKHEDRSDAFDYKHFLLLSGASELIKRNGSSSSSSGSDTSSVSSVYSVETTKPANMAKNALVHDLIESDHGSGHHVRKESADSVSTAATFATATEGRESDGDVEEESTPRNTIVAPPQAESPLGKGPSSSRLRGVTRPDTDNIAPTLRPVLDTYTPTHTHTPSSTGLLSASPADISPTSPVNGVVSLPAMPSLLTFLASLPPPPPPAAPGSAGTDLQQPQPQPQLVPSNPIKLGDGDRDLAERLVRSLTQVCISLEAASGPAHASSASSKHEARVCRRRLDAARRVLDGEVNGEAF